MGQQVLLKSALQFKPFRTLVAQKQPLVRVDHSMRSQLEFGGRPVATLRPIAEIRLRAVGLHVSVEPVSRLKHRATLWPFAGYRLLRLVNALNVIIIFLAAIDDCEKQIVLTHYLFI